MSIALPENPRQLRWMLARKLGVAATAISLVAGGISYALENLQAEHAALERAANGVQHFESPAMRLAIGTESSQEHAGLNRLLDRNQFVGIRVFNAENVLVYEKWEDIPPALIDAVRLRQHERPVAGQSARNWIAVAGERLIQIVLPLITKDGNVIGYVEGISRLTEHSLKLQRMQARNGALTAAASVLITAMLLYPLLLAMLRRTTALSRLLLDSNLSLMHSLGNAVAKRDSDTDAHNYRVTLYAVALAEAVGLPKQEIGDLIVGAFLHDIGKIGIPDEILLKPGKLTAEEFEIMKTHAVLGIEIVDGNRWLAGASLTIRYHHERFDGTGYPDGLSGDAIPRVARIFAVVDVFDALTSERPYKAPLSLAEALRIMESDSGQHFDSECFGAFRNIGPTLYAQIAEKDKAELRLHMHEVLVKYFKTEPAFGQFLFGDDTLTER